MIEPDETATAHPPIVYIIDDDEDVRRSISFLLNTDGIPNRSFRSGHEFLNALPDLAPGCVLLDVRMPGISGLDVLERLNASGRSWPVVVMTGHGEGDLATRAIMAGARHFIEKPFDADLLLHFLRNTSRC